MSRTRPTLLLGGFMGTGKSTVGRRVADRAGAPLVDLDAQIEARAGRSIPELFAAVGEPAFRALEAEALAELLALPGQRVVALGGGALLDPTRRRAALERACVVTLTARPATVVARTVGGGRPLLDGHPDRAARVAALLAERAGAYAEAHAVVPTDGRSPDEVAAAVLAAWDTPCVALPRGARSYAVRVVPDAGAEAARVVAAVAPSRVFPVTDETVMGLWGERVLGAVAAAGAPLAAPVVLPPGEPNKQLAGVERALRSMVTAGADRDALVVALGGGVVTDMAGFAAATLLRGVRWLAMPTTLLAMVDASVGGKTGVDLGPAKNAVGAFHQPTSVVTSPTFVTTQTPRDYVGGLAEVVKSAAIGDPALFELLEARAPAVVDREPDLVERIVLASVGVKAGIVGRDERESGERLLLNFGHTLGHALEAHGGFERWTHGEAVSLGMVAALRVGVRLGVTPPALAARVGSLLQRLGLPTDLAAVPLAEALPLVHLDKKRRGGAVRFVLLRALGEAVVEPCSPEQLSAALAGA